MSESSERPEVPAETSGDGSSPDGPSPVNPIESREDRREERGKHTLIFRELAVIAVLLLAILAFNLHWGNTTNRDMSAQARDEIKLRNVRNTKQPEPEKPEPKPEPKQPEPKPEPRPKVPKETPRREVPNETVEEVPEMSSKPETTPETESMDKIQSSELAETSEPAPEPEPKPKPEPPPEPPANKIFNKNAVDRNPQMRGSLQPEYPESAKRAGIEGTVILQFVVDESGRPQNITVLRSPNDMLSEAAEEAVRKVKFQPGRQNGQSVKVRMSQPVVFRLQ